MWQSIDGKQSGICLTPTQHMKLYIFWKSVSKWKYYRMCLHTFCFCRICESSTFIRLSFCFVLRATLEVNFKLCMVISSSFFSLMNTAGILESSSPVVQWRIFCLILFCVALGWTDTKNENLNVLSRYGNFLIILPRIIPIPLLNSVPETINYSVTIKSSQKT